VEENTRNCEISIQRTKKITMIIGVFIKCKIWSTHEKPVPAQRRGEVIAATFRNPALGCK
jgi:hypothetical protein